MTLFTGERFTVNTIQEVKDSGGSVIARFLPDLTYKVTPRNIEFVNGLVSSGIAQKYTRQRVPGFVAQSTSAKASGKIKVKTKG